MTGSDVQRTLERRRQYLEARRQELAARGTAGAGRGGVNTFAHPAGARVFDPVTGQEGEIVGGARENVVVPTAQR